MDGPTDEQIEELMDVQFGPIGTEERAGRALSFDDTRSWVDPNGSRLSDRVWKSKQDTRRRIDDIIRNGIKAGESSLDMAERAEKFLNPKYAVHRTKNGKIIADHRKGVLTKTPDGGIGSYSAQRLMRTEVTRAHGNAAQTTAGRIGGGIRWRLSGSHPRNDICNEHAGGNSSGLPAGTPRGVYTTGDVPQYPAHPHDLCTLQVWQLESNEALVQRLRQQYGLDEPPGGYINLPGTPEGARLGYGDMRINADEWQSFDSNWTMRQHSSLDESGRVRFTPERQRLHDQIVNEHLAGVNASSRPTFNMLGGGPASGKSTMEKSLTDRGLFPGKGKAVKVDPDHIKSLLPEYRAMTAAGDPLAAMYAHEESSYLAKRIQRAAMEGRRDVVLDGVGKSFESVYELTSNAGYRLAGQYAFVDPDVALARAIARGEKTGRFIPEDYLFDAHRAIARKFDAAADLFDEIVLYDTTNAPVLVARAGKGVTQVVDADRMRFFRSIADYEKKPAGYVELPHTPQFARRGLGDMEIDRAEWQSFDTEWTIRQHSFVDEAGNVRFTPEREALHDQIIRDAVNGIPAQAEPTFNMLGGGPAAGKSTMERSLTERGLFPEKGAATKIDPDGIKALLPEYQAMTAAENPLAAAYAHEESSYLAKRMQRAAMERRTDVVLDGVGKSFEKVATLTNQTGYKLSGQYAFVDPELALERAIARGEKTGRFIPEDYLFDAHREISQKFIKATQQFNDIVLYDTTDAALLVARAENGTLVVVDQVRWEYFQTIAKYER